MGFYVVGPMAVVAAVLLIWYWTRVFFAGGITTPLEDMTCAWCCSEYYYFEKENARLPYKHSLGLSRLHRIKGMFVAEIPRFVVMIGIVILFLVSGFLVG